MITSSLAAKKSPERQQPTERASPEPSRQPGQKPGPHTDILRLQRIIGNRGVDQLLRQSESDSLFREVDVPLTVQSVLKNSNGRPLEPAARRDMEVRFGQKLGQVSVHTDALAAQSAYSLDARAYTIGTDIVFAAGEYAPQTMIGKSLLAHELAHVIQWKNNPIAAPLLSPSRHPAEADANRAAIGTLAQPTSSPGGLIQCADANDIAAVQAVLNPGGVIAAGFGKGFINGAKSKIPAEAWATLKDTLSGQGNFVQFMLGEKVGIPVGAAKDVLDLLKGIWELLKLGIELSPAGMVYGELAALVKREESPTVHRLRMGKEFIEGFYQFVSHVKNNPSFLFDSGEGFGKVIGEEAGQWFSTEFVNLKPFDMGFKVGVVEGYIALEVAMLFLGPEEIALKGISTAARAAKGTRLGQEILKILEKIPALKRILDAKRAAVGAREAATVTEEAKAAVITEEELKAGAKLTEEAKQVEQAAVKAPPAGTSTTAKPLAPKTEALKKVESPQKLQPPKPTSTSAPKVAEPVAPKKAKSLKKPELSPVEQRSKEILGEFSERQRAARARGGLKQDVERAPGQTKRTQRSEKARHRDPLAGEAGHHGFPQYLGGKYEQELVKLPNDLHYLYHEELDKVLNIPRKAGSAFYKKLSKSEMQELLNQLLEHARGFDKRYGTKIEEAMRKGIEEAKPLEGREGTLGPRISDKVLQEVRALEEKRKLVETRRELEKIEREEQALREALEEAAPEEAEGFGKRLRLRK